MEFPSKKHEESQTRTGLTRICLSWAVLILVGPHSHPDHHPNQHHLCAWAYAPRTLQLPCAWPLPLRQVPAPKASQPSAGSWANGIYKNILAY